MFFYTRWTIAELLLGRYTTYLPRYLPKRLPLIGHLISTLRTYISHTLSPSNHQRLVQLHPNDSIP